MTALELITALVNHGAVDGNMQVTLSGSTIQSIDLEPAEAGCPARIDLVG